MLLSAKYNVNTSDSLSQTPLHIAILSRRLEIARELISSEANVNFEDSYGITPLRLAFQHQYHDLIDLLLKSAANTEDIMADNWLDAYREKTPNIIVLSKVIGEGRVCALLLREEFQTNWRRGQLKLLQKDISCVSSHSSYL